MIATRYETTTKNGGGILRVKHLDTTWVMKALLCVAATLLYLLMYAVTGGLTLAVLLPLAMFTPIYVVFGLPVGRAYVHHVHGNLSDEASNLVKSLKNVQNAAALRPDGVGITERSNEFGRLAFLMLHQMIAMRSVNVGRSTNTEKHKHISDLQVDAKNLAKSGLDLADLIATNRAASIYQDSKFLGVEEFNEAVNIELMAHRALPSGIDGD